MRTMSTRPIKHFAKGLCPPYLWEGLRSVYWRIKAPAAPPPSRPILIDLDEVPDVLARIAPLRFGSFDEFVEQLRRIRLRPLTNLPTDPDSSEYRETQMALYRKISGRPHYDAHTCEVTHLHQDVIDFPYPYWTHSCRTVGDHLTGLGHLIQALDLPQNGSILEFGPGYGKTTIEFAQMGFDVTAVDIYAPFLELTQSRCRALNREVKTVCADMLDFQSPQLYDRVLFNACFHHCSDHTRMVARLEQFVAPGGYVLFASEPIEDDDPLPWGLRTDGQSLWAIREGWLELGFRTDYFFNLLSKHGWTCDRIIPPSGLQHRLFIARRKCSSACRSTLKRG